MVVLSCYLQSKKVFKFFWASNPIHECWGTVPFVTFLGKCLLILFDQVTFLAPKVSFSGKCHRPSWISNVEATRDDFAIVVFTTKGPQNTRSLCYKCPLFFEICQFLFQKNLSVFTQNFFFLFYDVPKKMDKKGTLSKQKLPITIPSREIQMFEKSFFLSLKSI